MNEKELAMPTYTIKQVAAELQVSIPTVERWIRANEITVLRLGYRTVLITDKELNRIKREGLVEIDTDNSSSEKVRQ